VTPDPSSVQDPGTVLALDNVPLTMPVARAGSRSLAAFFDYLVVGALAVAWTAALIAGMAIAGEDRVPWLVAGYLLGLFAIEYGYFAGLELATRGRTLGKWIVDLHVVSADGSQASRASLLLRNLLRTPDIFLGVPLMVADPLARRLGDRLGGTLVVAAPGAPRRERESLLRAPRGWGAREIALLEDLLHRADDLPPARSRALAQRVVEWIDRDDPGFLGAIDRSRGPVAVLRAGAGLEEA